MYESKYLIFLLFLLSLHIFLCGLMTKEIFNWVPGLKKQILLCILVWCVPIVGILVASKAGKLGVFKPISKKTGDSLISVGFFEIDSVLNPGAKNRIEMIEKQRSGITEDGELHKVGEPLKGGRTDEKQEKT